MIVGGKILSFWTPVKEYWAQLPENFINLEKVFSVYSGYKHSSLSLYFFKYHVNTCTENRTIRLSIGVSTKIRICKFWRNHHFHKIRSKKYSSSNIVDFWCFNFCQEWQQCLQLFHGMSGRGYTWHLGFDFWKPKSCDAPMGFQKPGPCCGKRFIETSKFPKCCS